MDLLSNLKPLVLLGLPLLALLKLFNSRQRMQILEGRVGTLEGRHKMLERELRRMADGAKEGRQESAAEVTDDPVMAASQPEKPDPVVVVPAYQPRLVPKPEPPPIPVPEADAAAPIGDPEMAFALRNVWSEREQRSTPKTPALNWEQFMGVKLFAWLGGFALFLAAAFFVKYSFDHDLVPPELRVAIGFLVGLGSVVGGLWVSRERYRVTADTLCGAGVVILYGVTFACRSVYQFPLFGPQVTFGLMVGITAVAFMIAVRKDALVVAVLGMLGGFLTPLIVSTGNSDALALFSYLALLDIGLLAVAQARRWDWLALAAAIGTVCLELLWGIRYFNASAHLGIAMVTLLGFCALFLAAVFQARVVRKSNQMLIDAAMIPPLLTLLFTWTHLGSEMVGGRPMVLYTFLFGADVTLLAVGVGKFRRSVLGLVGSGVVFMILAHWMGLEVDSELLYWALSGTVVFALLHTAFPIAVRHWFPTYTVSPAHFLFPVIALALTAIPLVAQESTPFVIWFFVLLLDLVVVVGSVVLAWSGGVLVAALLSAALGFVWLGQEIGVGLALWEALTVVVGMAAFFTVASGFLLRFGKQARGRLGLQLPDEWRLPESVEAQVPALSGVMPFLLLVVIVGRVPMDSPVAVFGVAGLLGALLLGLHPLMRLEWLPLVGLGCTALVELAWRGEHLEAQNAPITLVGYLIFWAAYFGYPFVLLRCQPDRVLAWITAAVSAPVQFVLVYDLVRTFWPNSVMGLIPAAFAIPAFLGFYYLFRQVDQDHPDRNRLLAWFAGVGLLFVTLIFPIQLEREWLTLAWALEGVGLLWLFTRIPHAGLRTCALGLLGLTFVRLVFNPSVFGYHPRGDWPILNWYLYTYGIAAACFFVAPRFLRDANYRIEGFRVRPLLYGMGTVLCFLLLNIEIADFFSEPGRPVLTLHFRGDFARDMAYTIGWGLFALGLLVIGILKRIPAGRHAGLVLLAVTLIKLFFWDLASLTQLFRVGALVVVAVIAIVASTLYQRFLRAETNLPEDGDQAGEL